MKLMQSMRKVLAGVALSWKTPLKPSPVGPINVSITFHVDELGDPEKARERIEAAVRDAIASKIET